MMCGTMRQLQQTPSLLEHVSYWACFACTPVHKTASEQQPRRVCRRTVTPDALRASAHMPSAGSTCNHTALLVHNSCLNDGTCNSLHNQVCAYCPTNDHTNQHTRAQLPASLDGPPPKCHPVRNCCRPSKHGVNSSCCKQQEQAPADVVHCLLADVLASQRTTSHCKRCGCRVSCCGANSNTYGVLQAKSREATCSGAALVHCGNPLHKLSCRKMQAERRTM